MENRTATAAAIQPVVETAQGKIRGVRERNCYSFKGIRYASAERFGLPRAPAKWSGIRDALEFGASAPQSDPNPPDHSGPPAIILAQLPRSATAGPPPKRQPESEDCLFLNVWSAGINDGRKRPVMVSLHGGFFSAGSGSGLDGSMLAGRGDVVVVSLNHRLNLFGFTHLEDLGGRDFAFSGNAGMFDILAALEWVRDNIEAFGGDPARVMVFGTSGGGMKTSFLLASPRARGLLHRSAVESGPGLRFMEPDAASKVTERLLSKLNLGVAQMGELRTMPMQRLLAAYHAIAREMPPKRFIDLPCFAPVIDSLALPRQPFSPDAAPQTAEIPMLTGWNAQEMTFFMGNDPQAFTLVDEESAIDRASAFLGDRSRSVMDFYRAAYPNVSASRRYIQAFSDYSLMLPELALAERKTALGGAPNFVYRFDFQSPALGGKLGAFHTLQNPFEMNTVGSSRPLVGPGEEPLRLAAQMSAAWVQFAATGDPNGAAPGLPTWPRYDLSARPTMVLNLESHLENDPTREARQLLAPLLEA